MRREHKIGFYSHLNKDCYNICQELCQTSDAEHSPSHSLGLRERTSVPLGIVHSRFDLTLVQRETALRRLPGRRTPEPSPTGRIGGIFLASFPVYGCVHSARRSPNKSTGRLLPWRAPLNLLPLLVPLSKGTMVSSYLYSHPVHTFLMLCTYFFKPASLLCDCKGIFKI